MTGLKREPRTRRLWRQNKNSNHELLCLCLLVSPVCFKEISLFQSKLLCGHSLLSDKNCNVIHWRGFRDELRLILFGRQFYWRDRRGKWCLYHGNNGIDRPARLSACFSQNESFALMSMSLRVHHFLYEMRGAPCKFSFCAGFSSYDLEDLRDSHWTMPCVLYFDLKGHSIYMTSCRFCLATVVLMPFVAFCSGLVWLISVCLVTV